jgi:hypothetical protein
VTWDEHVGHVTRSFDRWVATDREIRAYAKLADGLATASYDLILERVSSQPADGDLDFGDALHDAVDGIYPPDFSHMMLSGVYKDLLTAFEVYLEQVRTEAGGPTPPVGESPSWDELTDFCKVELRIQLKGIDELQKVRGIRRRLTHSRGLRRPEARNEHYTDQGRFIDRSPALTLKSALNAADVLAKHVRRVDRAAYECT